MTDELTAAHAEIARLRAKYQPVQADPVEVLVADYNKLLAGMAGHNAAYTMRAVLNAHGWRQVREVTEAEIMDAVNVFGSAYHATMPQILEAAVRHGIALARGEV